ncbi:MAG: ribonuclease HII [Saccharospirillaceae bacterium]|nr:ribonuclease HII [Saccharospirillaceae bacterium]
MSAQNDLFLTSQYDIPLSCGVDEVGRGPLNGDVVTAAVILDPRNPIAGLNDSKKLTEKKRLKLFDEIKEHALCYAIAYASPEEVDEINILQASLLAMSRAVNDLSMQPSHAFIDGNKIPKNLPCEATFVVKGDSKVASIAAASILAKVTRDQQMFELHEKYPQYGFANHKGYPTKAHLLAIQEHGLIAGYRKTYGPVKRILEKN